MRLQVAPCRLLWLLGPTRVGNIAICPLSGYRAGKYHMCSRPGWSDSCQSQCGAGGLQGKSLKLETL
jgi:hypothetical protein